MILVQERFEDEVLNAAGPVLVDLFRPDCGPCRRLAPVLDELAAEGYQVCKIDVSERPEVAVRFGISAVPTLVIVKNGQEVERLVGAHSARALRNSLDRAAQ